MEANVVLIQSAEIFSFENRMAMVQKYADFYLFVLANEDENELMVMDLLDCMSDCLAALKAKGE